MFVTRWYSWKNASCGFSPVWITKCLLRCPTWLNDFSHHRLSPLWESMWIFRLLYLLRFPAWLNELMHSEHLCDFSPLWITSLIKWFVTFGARVRLFPCVNEQMSSRISSLTIKLLFAFCAFVRLLFLFLASPYGRLGGWQGCRHGGRHGGGQGGQHFSGFSFLLHLLVKSSCPSSAKQIKPRREIIMSATMTATMSATLSTTMSATMSAREREKNQELKTKKKEEKEFHI